MFGGGGDGKKTMSLLFTVLLFLLTFSTGREIKKTQTTEGRHKKPSRTGIVKD